MLAFASITPNGNWDTLSTDLADSYSAVRAFWPGGPVQSGTRGAAVTYNGLSLPSFTHPQPPFNSSALTAATSISNNLTAILIDRTPYAAYYSLGAIMAVAKVQAAFAHNREGNVQAAWNLAVEHLDMAISLANALCRPAPNVWRTAFNVQEMRQLRSDLPPGPTNLNWPGFGSHPSLVFHDRLGLILNHLGAVIASPSTLESGVHGLGCL